MRSDATCALLTCCSQLMSPPASCPFLVISSKISHTQSSLASSLLSFFHWFYPNQAPKQDHTLHLVVSFLKSFLILTDCLSPNPLLILAFWGRQCPLSHFLDSRDSSTSSGFFFFFFFLPSISYKLKVLKARRIQVECFLDKYIADDTKYTSFPPATGWGQLIPRSCGHIFPVQACISHQGFGIVPKRVTSLCWGHGMLTIRVPEHYW